MNSMNITVSEKLLRSNAHIIEFLILGVFLSLYGIDTNKNMTTIVIYGFGLGLVDELIRVFLPTREFELVDLLKDWLGIVIAVFIVYYWKKRD